VLEGVHAAGYTRTTPIQLRAIAILMSVASDLIGSAQDPAPASTAAFALSDSSRDYGQHGTLRTLVLGTDARVAAQG